MRLVVGISGATGATYGVRLLEILSQIEGVETELVMSKWAETTIGLETQYKAADVQKLATRVHPISNLAATISSGSYPVDAMVVIPCSMKTLASIRMGLSDNLITRAADVTIKERRKLVILPRESPLSAIHLEHMLDLARLGVVILPPMPAFYSHVKTISDLVDHTIARVLDQLAIPHKVGVRWGSRRNEETD